MSSLEFMIARIEVMDKRIGQLERSNMIYALQLFNLGFLPEEDPRYLDCQDIIGNSIAETKSAKEDSRNLYYKEVTEGNPEE
tara:strand:- start:161 stop:406 length:246 start_codon:yes stop_codon:yes gene_type:complete